LAFLFIYVTCRDEQEAQGLARALLEQRIVACANILTPHQSLYWWEGKIQSAPEAAVIFKTREDLFEKLEAAIKERHSYDCPCIVALPVEKGHAPFLQWIEAETQK
jgi:periplasmic divalent cation tolerance protein